MKSRKRLIFHYRFRRFSTNKNFFIKKRIDTRPDHFINFCKYPVQSRLLRYKKYPPQRVGINSWSGQRDWLDFLLKNLRRCVGFIWRYSRLAKPPCQTRYLACSQLIACNLQTKKATFSGDFFLFVVGATRFEHATSWSQTKRSTRLSYAPSTDLVITTYFSILQALFYFFLIFGKIKPELRKLKISFLVTIKWS